MILILLPISSFGQEGTRAATQAEVNAGIVRNKFVSPRTLGLWTGAGTNAPVTAASQPQVNGGTSLTNYVSPATLNPTRSAVTNLQANAVTNRFTPALVLQNQLILSNASFGNWVFDNSDGNGVTFTGTAVDEYRFSDGDFFSPNGVYAAGAHGFVGIASGLTNANATTLFSSGTVPVSRLGTGTPDGTKFLRDDSVFAVPTASLIVVTNGVTLNSAAAGLAFVDTEHITVSGINTGATATVRMSLIVTNGTGPVVQRTNSQASGLTLLTAPTNTQATASSIAMYDSSKRLTNAVLGSGLTLNAGVLSASGGGGAGSNETFYAYKGAEGFPGYTFAAAQDTGFRMEETGPIASIEVYADGQLAAEFAHAAGIEDEALTVYGGVTLTGGYFQGSSLITGDTVSYWDPGGRLVSGVSYNNVAVTVAANNFTASNKFSSVHFSGAQFFATTNTPGFNWATSAPPVHTWSTNANWPSTTIVAANANQRLQVVWTNSGSTTITNTTPWSFNDRSLSNAVVSQLAIPGNTVIEGEFRTDANTNYSFRITASANNKTLVSIVTAALTATVGQVLVSDGAGSYTNGTGGSGSGDALLASNNHFVASNRFGGALYLAGAQFFGTTNTPGFNWATSAPPVHTWSTNANWPSTTIVAANANQRLQVVWTNSGSTTITNTTPWSFNDRSLSNAVVSQLAIPGNTVIEGEFRTDANTNYSFRITASANNKTLVSIVNAASTATVGQVLLSDGAGGVSITGQTLDVSTNSWTANAAFGLGTNAFLSQGAATIGIPGLANVPTSTARYGELTLAATGTVIFTNLASIQTSDFLTSRTITNGNTAVIAISVMPGRATNMAIVQFK